MSKKYENETLNVRQSTYGDFSDNARVSQELKLTIHTSEGYKLLTDIQKESLDVICTKISRIMGGDSNYKDNWHDIAGYAQLAEKEIEG